MGEWHEVEDKAAEHKKYLQQKEENRRKRWEKLKRRSEKYRGGSGFVHDEDEDRDSGSLRPRAIMEHGEHERHRSKSMSIYDDDRDSRALEKAQSRRRYDD